MMNRIAPEAEKNLIKKVEDSILKIVRSNSMILV